MIGWLMLRSVRKATRTSGTSKATAKTEVPWSEFKSRSGQTAIIIFATMFIGAVVLIGWFVNHAANAGH